MSAIELARVAKRYGATPVLTNIGLTVPDGSMTAVLGSSGSGKTTLLRLIAGFDNVDAGTITIGGHPVDDGHRAVRPQHRDVGYVPQDGALFPHLTVRGNIGFGVSRRDRHTAARLINLVGLDGLERRYPHQLSGGQQQRVALARALAIQPKVILLDEPFSSLDASLRDTVRRDVTQVLAHTGVTTILVTHDRDEALALADQIVILRDGNVEAAAGPQTLYHNPPTIAAAISIGEANILPAQVQGDRAHSALGTIRLRTTEFPVLDGPSLLLLRPEQLILNTEPRARAIASTVVDCQYHGHAALVHLAIDRPDRQIVLARVPGRLLLTAGQTLWIEVDGSGKAWPRDSSTTTSGNHGRTHYNAGTSESPNAVTSLP